MSGYIKHKNTRKFRWKPAGADTINFCRSNNYSLIRAYITLANNIVQAYCCLININITIIY